MSTHSEPNQSLDVPMPKEPLPIQSDVIVYNAALEHEQYTVFMKKEFDEYINTTVGEIIEQINILILDKHNSNIVVKNSICNIIFNYKICGRSLKTQLTENVTSLSAYHYNIKHFSNTFLHSYPTCKVTWEFILNPGKTNNLLNGTEYICKEALAKLSNYYNSLGYPLEKMTAKFTFHTDETINAFEFVLHVTPTI